ncbi:hypothetical protein MMC22_005990 [Lobaria immixta]|nr:hypothetical protein [Lobaria immixta]
MATRSSQAPVAKTPFLQERERLVGEIATVGNEFGAVEALWSQFEGVMTKEDESGTKGEESEEGRRESGDEGGEGNKEENEAETVMQEGRGR